MIHNGIEYGDMQLIAEAYDVLKSVGKLSNEELRSVFSEWNKGELLSFLIEITADIFGIKDDKGEGYLVDKVLDKTGMKGTGKWTVQQAAELSVAAPTIESSLDARFLSGLKEERVKAAEVFKSGGFGDILTDQVVDKKKLINDVRQALYASKICSYAQGMNLIRAKSIEKGWNLELGNWLGFGRGAYDRNSDLANLLVDPEFAKEIIERQSAWRRVVCLAINSGISTPGMSASLAYFDTYRRARLPANLVQAQRDYFGAHTYERTDVEGSFHTEWFKLAKMFLSGLKEERVKAAEVFKSGGFGDILTDQVVDKKKLINDVRQALYASKICSYAQGMNLIRAKSIEKGWNLELGNWLGFGRGAYDRNSDLANLLVDPEFAKEIISDSLPGEELCALLSTLVLAPRACLPVLLILTLTEGQDCQLIWSKLSETILVLIHMKGLMWRILPY
ncbi:6-phosphogluconate dehydrogenase [Quercus suber]|uniref:6-phosphogluconate dehydrogenase, decarboxylating n=1 Tax=Quercus suber TaxID=58331 RepID=A0AAW0JCE8_QUESU